MPEAEGPEGVQDGQSHAGLQGQRGKPMDDVASFRPISILPSMSKIMERAALLQLAHPTWHLYSRRPSSGSAQGGAHQ